MRCLTSSRLLLPFLILAGFSLSGSHNFPECKAADLSSLQKTVNPHSEFASEHELLMLTNQYRLDQGLEALTPDDALIQIAREHSQSMARQGFISHDQPSGNLKTRMNRAGYLYEVVRENVASAHTVSWAQKALIASPRHSENILANDITRVGIGIVRFPPPLDGQIYITEIFASPRDPYEPSMVNSLLENRVNELRQEGAGSFLPDPEFEKLASRSVLSLSLPFTREDLRNLLAASAEELQEKADLSRLEIDVQLLHNPKNLSIPASEREGLATMYGSAVRQVTDDQNQAAFLVLTLIGITR